MPKPLRLALIGNCQVQTYRKLSERMVAGCEVILFDFSEPYSRDEERRARFGQTLSDVDHIFLQTNAFSHTNEAELQALYPDKVTKIANFYFRGLHPDSCYVGDFAERFTDPTAVNSVIVLDAFTRGLDEATAVRAFCPETYHRLGLFAAWRSSIAEMRRRDAQVDLVCADFMDDACRHYPTFLTMNHPSMALLKDYLGRVFDLTGIAWRDFDTLREADPLALHDTVPIADEVAEHFKLPYRTTQRWKINSLDQRFVDRAEFVAAFYRAYAAAPRERLRVHSPSDLVEHLADDPSTRHLVEG